MSSAMSSIRHLLDRNRAWAADVVADEPDFFRRLAAQQAPRYLWIGCADSRVPANDIVGLMPGELFVHRNIANVVVHTDLNCLSVIQFATEMLKVRHIIVCGHYGCSGVNAALRGDRGEDELLVSCYRNSLALARQHGVASIAFPAISTGVYRFPLERATRIAVKTVAASRSPEMSVIFACFGDEALAAYRRELAAVT